MGCGATLVLALDRTGDVGRITCSKDDCPRADAVHEILVVNESEHIVVLADHDFSVLHPLRERLEQKLLRCPLTEWLRNYPAPPKPPGRYRVKFPDLDLDKGAPVEWERLEDEE